MIWSGLGHTTSGKAVPSPEEVEAEALAASDVEMVPPELVPGTTRAPATPLPPPPPGPPPPAGTALAALFPYVIHELDSSVTDKLHEVAAKAKAKAAPKVVPTPVRSGAAAASSAM
eukprot:1111022-Prorocentrum_lima.AAC.1